MSKRIWTQSRQIEAQCSTQNKRGNWGRLGVNRGQSGSIGSQLGSIGGNREQSGAIWGQSGAIGGSRGQSGGNQGQTGASWRSF